MKQDKSTLKEYFKTGAYPTEAQFGDAIDSFVHKDDTIEARNMPQEISVLLNGKENASNKKLTINEASDTDYPTSGAVARYVQQQISAVFVYKGSVESYENLPTEGRSVGDTYNVKDNGVNYVWNGEDWDALGTSIDLRGYATAQALSSGLNTKQDKLTAGANINIDENNVISASSESSIFDEQDGTIVPANGTSGLNVANTNDPSINPNTLACGEYPQNASVNSTPADEAYNAVFQAGNGASRNSKSNSFIVTKNGNAYLAGVGGFVGTETQSAADLGSKHSVQEVINGKQEELTFDNVPTENSTNPVKSGGVYSGLAQKEEKAQTQTFVDEASFAIADNTIYTASEAINKLEILGSNGTSAVSFDTAASGTITITLPLSIKFAETPTFGNSEHWEIAVRNGYAVFTKYDLA